MQMVTVLPDLISRRTVAVEQTGASAIKQNLRCIRLRTAASVTLTPAALCLLRMLSY